VEVLSRDMEIFLAQLAELAGGDSRIVQEAISNVNRKESAPTLDELVYEILRMKRDSLVSLKDTTNQPA
jgi:predicted regulator of amino acid metabolism with ACT domain